MDLKSVITNLNVSKDWRNRYKQFVPRFIDEAASKQNWKDWDQDIFYEYFEKSAGQCISSLQQGYFSDNERERIKENWESISQLLKQVATRQDVLLYDVYQAIRNEISKHTDSNKDAAVNRMIAGLQPQLMSTIVSYKHLNELKALLKSKCNLELTNYQYNNWFKDSNEVLNLFKSAIPNFDIYDIMTYPWQTLEFLRENDIKAATMQIEKDKVIELLKYKKQIILQGPPGTGKTRRAKELAAELIGLDVKKSIPATILDNDMRRIFKPNMLVKSVAGNASYEIIDILNDRIKSRKGNGTIDETPFQKIKVAYQERKWDSEIEDNHTRRAAAFAKHVFNILPNSSNRTDLNLSNQYKIIQFHPSYSYEDFVRGIVAESKGDKIEYKSINKILGKFATEAKKNLEDSKKDIRSISKENKTKEYFEMFADDLNDRITGSEAIELTPKVKIIDVDDDAFRYKGSDGWSPLGNRMLFKDIIQAFLDGNTVRQDIKNNKNLSGLAIQHASYFVRVLIMFQNYLDTNNLRFDQLVNEKPELKNYVLIIDEINRANLSSVLGELIYALEYRGENVESMYEVDGSNNLVLPDNLYIIGTMNTADRSVGNIDYAIRRRFAFVDMEPLDLTGELGNKFHKELFNKVAVMFNTNRSPEFEKKDVQLGHSYFIDKSDEGGSMATRLQYEIKPILLEYIKDGILVGDNIKIEIENLQA